MSNNNYIMAPKLFNTGFLKNDSKLRQKQSLPLQNFGSQSKDPSQYHLCNKNEIYPIQGLSPNYGQYEHTPNNQKTPMSST